MVTMAVSKLAASPKGAVILEDLFIEKSFVSSLDIIHHITMEFTMESTME